LTGNPYRSFYGNEGRTNAPTAPQPDASTRPTPSVIPGSDLPRMPGPSDAGGGALAPMPPTYGLGRGDRNSFGY